MPHIKVAPFDTKMLKKKKDVIFLGNTKEGNSELLLVKKEDKILIFDLIKRENEYLLKPNKISRGSNTELLKSVLNEIANEFSLEVILHNTAVKKHKEKVDNFFLKTIEDFYDFQPNYEHVELEVGFGSGRHLLYQAKNKPNTLFIGVEIHTPSIEQVLKQLHLQKINNVYIINYDARLLLEMFPSNILEKIYVHFPVPWDKKPHRRVISKKFLQEALRVLKKGAMLELRTDSINYFNYSLELFNSLQRVSYKVQKNIDIEVESKYEARWKRMQKDIFTLWLESLTNDLPKEVTISFDFEKSEKNDNIANEIIKEEDFFVHFTREFRDNEQKIIECSFGAFSMPEKKMLYFNGKYWSYLPTNPAKSLSNFKAHQKIKEVLHGKCN